jgi:poly(A) polymerase
MLPMTVDDQEQLLVEPEERAAICPTVIPASEHPIHEQDLDREALKVLYRLRDAGFKGYLVGGGVRDLYLGRAPKDFDISTDARPGQIRQIFRNSRTIGNRFRLVQVFFRGNKIIEVSTLRSRSEFDIKGEDQLLAANNTFGTLEDDAFRRDLTINALFYEIENQTVIDYIGGVHDLQQGIIRVVGEPDRRFTRDPVRMMRVIRHAARTGFTIEEATFIAVQQHKEKLRLCPPSRIRDEVLKDLQSGASCAWAALAHSSGLWSVLFPFYDLSLSNEQGGTMLEGLFSICRVLDRLQVKGINGASAVKLPDALLFAALLLPWACQRFNLPETNVRGPGFQQLSNTIREEIDLHFGEPFNVQRMARDSLATLLINLSTIHHARVQGDDPKWLKKKSYYADSSRFYAIYLEAQGVQTAAIENFVTAAQPVAEGLRPAGEEEQQTDSSGGMGTPATQEKSGGGVANSGASKSRGRGGSNPAFSSVVGGVFGLRQS